MSRQQSYVSLTPRMMMQLAAPHTWVAAVIPVLVGTCIAIPLVQELHHELWLCMLVTCILMQSGVNTLNDYMDFKKGADTLENQLDSTDAVMVYNNVNPKDVLHYFFALMGIALVLGLFLVFRSSLTTLWIGIAGAIVLVVYSVGKTPLSYLPLGEIASGFTMGGLICLATAYILTGVFDWAYLVQAIPLILGIGLINFTNNMCDIEKDMLANRKTLPVLMGRKAAIKLYHVTMAVIVASIIVLTVVFRAGMGLPGTWPALVMFPIMCFPIAKNLYANPLVLQSRGPAMGQVIMFNICCGTFYALALAC